MHYMLLCCFAEAAWTALPDDEKNRIMREYGALIRGLAECGRLRGGGRLHLTSSATTVRVQNGRPVFTDGPFAETKEQLGGYHVVDCRDLDEALSIAARIPTLPAGGAIEVRPIDSVIGQPTTKEGSMLLRFVSLTCLALFVLASPVMAKDKKAAPMDQQAMMEMWKKLAEPGEPHKLFASLAGSWTTNTKEWMEPGKPPMESAGSVEMKMLLDGRFLQQEFAGDMMGQPYRGVGISGYDNLRKRYVTAWIDSMGTGIFMMEGTAGADGRTITLKGQHEEPGGGRMTHRAVWKIVDANSQTFEMYGAHGQGKETKMMEITYTRKP